MASLDSVALCRSLADSLRQGWQSFRSEHPDETVYGVGVYSCPMATYVGMTLFSEEGLTEAAASYAGPDGELDEQRKQLRWSPCDSPHHMWAEACFDGAQAVLDAAPNPYGPGADSASHVQSAFAAFVQALRELDREGLFGDGLGRPLLSIWCGDQSDADRIDFARQLNDATLVSRFEDEIARGYVPSS